MSTKNADPTEPIRTLAAALPDVVSGTSCTQSAFKTKKGAFLYIGPGPKSQGFKAMFKLEASRAQAAELAAEDPEHFELGTGSWVVARFTAEKPLRASLWRKWLKESHALTTGTDAAKTAARSKPAPARKKARAKKA